MRSLRLVHVAAEAEALRLRYITRRNVIRAVLGLAALCFLLGAIILSRCSIVAAERIVRRRSPSPARIWSWQQSSC
jgi:hypothetical protein